MPKLMAGLGDIPDRLLRWFRRLPAIWLVLVAVVLVGGVGAAAAALYRTYNYVQHDNDFCLSCHLMAEPYSRFARSAHRGLGCKACHHPTFAVRSKMALTQILEQPKQLAVHAEVPNSRCAACHINGDPKKWEQIANTAGHRVHLESNDPSLRGLQCVKCHSSSLHEFAATDKTCGQAGCHSDIRIRLGKMANLTIHCATCHDFTRPVPAGASSDTALARLLPQRQQCLSCHAMRTMLANFPPDDPHNGNCSACHNPHTQTTPRQAGNSCVICHSRPDTLTAFHRGLDPGVLENCIQCHKAHSFRVNGADCLLCHKNIYQDQPGGGQLPEGHQSVVHGVSLDGPAGMLPSLWQQTTMPQQVDSLRFKHSQHRGVQCLKCHSESSTHGGLKVTSIRDCRACHHTDAVTQTCTDCHAKTTLDNRTFAVKQQLDLSTVSHPVERTLHFNHATHGNLACKTCHTGYLDLSASKLSCDQCHSAHHQSSRDCMACHPAPPTTAHTTMSVHVGCSGSGCHNPPPFKGLPHTRNVCLVCHQDKVDHRPGQNCVNCHVLPPANGGSGSAGMGGTDRSVNAVPQHPLTGNEGRGDTP
ncbi:MAG: hypothetical protein P8099_04325 [Gemmatimonadota bacterium]